MNTSQDVNYNKVGRAAGVDPAHVYRVINGGTNPSLETAAKIAKAMGISLDALMKLRKRKEEMLAVAS